MAKLTKIARESLRNDYQTDDALVIAALDDLDAADEEIVRLNAALAESERRAKEHLSLARMIYRRYVDGDDFFDEDWRRMREARVCDTEGFEIYDEDEGDGDGD